ncbi:MAG: extracellular solute-binding protein [Bifidobacteriaceae bacterium]|jgi:raffinose/stachyose/melibiose transport system substrate-binding protein|nr:extracellular solute-binding protein [Bifidobacteriaceae bacterium]
MQVKRILVAVTALAAVAALAGCQSSDDGGNGGSDATSGGEATSGGDTTSGDDTTSGGDTDQQTSGEAVELSLWMLTQDGSQGTGIETIISGFEAANPGITIKLETRETDEHKDAMRQAAGTPAEPDLYFYWEGPGLGGELVDQGVSLDLTSYYQQYGWDARFSEAVLANITQYGGYHGVPWTIQGEALYYNKDLFAQAGIDALPTNYDELVAAADKLVAAGITPISVGGTVNWHVMRVLDSFIEAECGAETGNALNTLQASWADTPCVTEVFTDLKTWGDKYFNEGYMGIDNNQASDLFYMEVSAMQLEGTWFDAQIVDGGLDPEKVGILPFPTGTGRLYGFGEALYIGAQSKHPDEAAKFLDYMSSTSTQEQVVGIWGALSVNKDVAPATDNPLHALWPPIFDSATGLYLNNDQNMPLDATTEYWRIQNSVLTGDIAPENAGTEFQKFIDAR